MQHTQQKWNAEDYARNSSAQFALAQELISKLNLGGSESVLDIGCGDGKISAQIAEVVKKGKVFGIDLSDDMIRHASAQFPSADYPNLYFLRMSATDIRLLEKFDVAFSNATLHWVKDHVAVIRGVRASLKPGGKLLFQMGGRGNVVGISRAMEAAMRSARWRQYFENFTSPYHFYGPEDYETWLPENGFRPVRMELMPKDMRHQGTEGLTGWLRTTWFPYTDRLPANLRDVFLAEAVELYTQAHPTDARGNTHVNLVRLEVEAYAL